MPETCLLMKTFVPGLAVNLALASSAFGAEIGRIWLTHRSPEPSRIVINWETTAPGSSVVNYGPSPECTDQAIVSGSDTLHHVEIPIPHRDTIYYYRVESGSERSAVHRFKSCPSKELRVAVAANWHARPSLDAIRKDDVHLLMTFEPRH